MKTYPLLQSQIGVLLQNMQHPESTRYNQPNYIFMPLSMTLERVVNTAQKLVDSFPELHTRFVIGEDGEARQWSDLSMQIPVVSRKCSQAELPAYIHEGFLRPFDPLGNEPLFRVEVVETEENICLLSDGYHAIVDGMSFAPILTTAFTTIFEGGSVEPQPYGLYQAADDEAAMLGTEVYQRAKAYYAEKFAGLEMATLSHNQPGTMGQMGRCKATIGRSVCDDWCREHGIQPVLLFQAAFGHVMSVLTRQAKVAFASVNHGRVDKRLHSSIGMFVKSVPTLVNADPSQRVIDFVKSQRVELMSAIRYGAYPFTHFCSDLQMKPGVTFNFKAVANMDEFVMVEGVKLRAVQPVRNETDSDLSVDIYLKDDSYEIRVESSLAMNDAATLRMVAEAVGVAVGNMIAHPELTLGELDIVSADEREALITLGCGKQIDIDPQLTFVGAFEQCASQHPDRLAVADATSSLTYRELSRLSDVLAHRLIAAGVNHNDFVAVMLERVKEFPVSVLSIHKAGAAYVPLDLDNPVGRLKTILSDSQPKAIVTTHSVWQRLMLTMDDDVNQPKLVFVDDVDFSAMAEPVCRTTPDHLAYMIYTSGSTGRPKGVMIRQRSLSSYIASMVDVHEITSADHISLFYSFAFDGHIHDFYPELTVGGSLHIIPSAIRHDIQGIRDFIVKHGITGCDFPTPLGTMLLESGPLSMRFMGLGGERMKGLVSGDVQLFNCYGPTECTDLIAVYKLERGRSYTNIPIGRPMANSHCFIVDTQDRLLPRGVEGELCFASAQVGLGYWNQPELTAEKFVPCPFLRPFGSKRPEVERLPLSSDGQPVRMYRTGDICRWNDEGQLEYIGRTDDQVKLRGFRIEMGEIESCASKFEGISQAVAVIRPIGGSATLCLYYTAHGNINESALCDYLSQSLANYMVPLAYMQLDALPFTPNGKVDRRRLPEPTLHHSGYVAPRNELERLLVSGFEKVLNQERISVNDDFIRLGGDSLSALRLVYSLDQSGITVADVLSLRTPAAIASNAKRISVNLNRYSLESGCPLNNTQLFIFNDILRFNKYDSYLIPSLIPIDSKYTDEQIRNALDVMFTAHPVLTMHVAIRDGVPYMEKGDKPAVMKGSLNPLKILSLLTSGFDLYSSLSRHVIVRIPGRCYLLSVIHHLIFDEISNNVFCRHFLRALEGEPLDFVDDHFLKISSFHQEVRSTEQYAEMDKYIRSMLNNLSEANFYRNPGKHGRPGYHKLELGVDREQVNRFAERFGITKNILFTAAMAMTLSKLAGSDDVAFGFLDNGRDRFDNYDDIGLYINAMPLVAHVDHHNMRAFLTRLSDVYYELSQNNYFPIGSLVQEFNIAPIILFQFFPDWITENGKYDHLPKNETLINKVVSTQKDFIVEALVDVMEMKDSYILRVFHSGYYTRKMMKALAATYNDSVAEMLKV